MLLDAIHRTEVNWADFHLIYDGCESLKGVLEGEPYPIIWLDTEDGRQSDEEKLLGTSRESKPHVLRAFLSKFVDTTMMRPFISTDADGKYRTVPDAINEKRQKMMAMENQTSENGSAADQFAGDDPKLPVPKPPPDVLPGVPM